MECVAALSISGEFTIDKGTQEAGGGGEEVETDDEMRRRMQKDGEMRKQWHELRRERDILSESHSVMESDLLYQLRGR